MRKITLLSLADGSPESDIHLPLQEYVSDQGTTYLRLVNAGIYNYILYQTAQGLSVQLVDENGTFLWEQPVIVNSAFWACREPFLFHGDYLGIVTYESNGLALKGITPISEVIQGNPLSELSSCMDCSIHTNGTLIFVLAHCHSANEDIVIKGLQIDHDLNLPGEPHGRLMMRWSSTGLQNLHMVQCGDDAVFVWQKQLRFEAKKITDWANIPEAVTAVIPLHTGHYYNNEKCYPTGQGGFAIGFTDSDECHPENGVHTRLIGMNDTGEIEWEFSQSLTGEDSGNRETFSSDAYFTKTDSGFRVFYPTLYGDGRPRVLAIDAGVPLWNNGGVALGVASQATFPVAQSGEYHGFCETDEFGMVSFYISRLDDQGNPYPGWTTRGTFLGFGHQYWMEVFDFPEGVLVIWDSSVDLGNFSFDWQWIRSDGQVFHPIQHFADSDTSYPFLYSVARLPGSGQIIILEDREHRLVMHVLNTSTGWIEHSSEYLYYIGSPVGLTENNQRTFIAPFTYNGESCFLVTWSQRVHSHYDVMIQCFNQRLVPIWPDETTLCNLPFNQMVKGMIAMPDGSIVVGWLDDRTPDSTAGSGIPAWSVHTQRIMPSTSVQHQDNPPMGIRMHHPRPNPFNPETVIGYNLDEPQHVELAVYNIKGQKIRTLVHDYLPSGSYEVLWDGKDHQGTSVASGVYFCRLSSQGRAIHRKVLLLK